MSAYDFFLSYLALPVVLFFYAIGYAWKREGWKKLSEIDVDSGRREPDYDALQKLRAKKAAWPWWRRALDKVF
jgi:yeast amino acid transporter